MAVERTYYTIDPEGKLTCMKCKVPLVKGKAKFMYLENGFPVEMPVQIILQTPETSIIQKFLCKFLNKNLTSQSSKYTFIICTHLFITFFYCHIFLLFIPICTVKPAFSQ